MSPRLLRSIAKTALLLSSTALSLIFIELGLTAWYGSLTERGPLEVVEEWGSPFVFKARSAPESQTHGTRHSEGFELRAPVGTKRILSYGDSIAGGHQLEEQQTYAHLLERELGLESDDRVEVLNMLRGHSPTIYTFHVRVDVPRFQPDGVILEIELINDVSDEARVRLSGQDQDGLPLEIHRHRYILGWDGHILSPIGINGSIFERTKLYAKVSRWYGRVRNQLDPNPLFGEESDVTFYSLYPDRFFLTPPALEHGFEQIFRSVAGIHTYLERQGIPFLLIILPSRHVFTGDRFSRSSRAILERAKDRARQLQIPFISMDGALADQGGAELFMDFCHPTERGNEVIAAKLKPILASW